jgi:RimJ/RimL family protein N-acetyltransferase
VPASPQTPDRDPPRNNGPVQYPPGSWSDRLRMISWLALGIALYAVSIIAGPERPLIQTTLYKFGHVTTLAFIGYWISRHALGRVSADPSLGNILGRAIVMGAVVIAGSLGL